MAKYKFTLVYLIEAASKTAAIEVMAKAFRDGTSQELREYESVKEVTTEKNGWEQPSADRSSGSDRETAICSPQVAVLFYSAHEKLSSTTIDPHQWEDHHGARLLRVGEWCLFRPVGQARLACIPVARPTPTAALHRDKAH